MLRMVVLISGGGSNLQSLLDACAAGQLQAQVVAVISNKPEVKGLARAQAAGVPTEVLSHNAYPEREDFDRALAERIDGYAPDLVVLAGFMRILSPGFVSRYLGRLLNIHPSLLPLYPGLHTHQRALEAGDSHHGASVHFVTAELDGGPVILQDRVAIAPDDTPQSLAAKVLEREHRIYPLAVSWLQQRRLVFKDGAAWLDGEPLPATGVRAWELAAGEA